MAYNEARAVIVGGIGKSQLHTSGTPSLTWGIQGCATSGASGDALVEAIVEDTASADIQM